MATKTIYVISVHELAKYIPCNDTGVRCTITRTYKVPEWMKRPADQYMLYEITMDLNDYCDKMHMLRMETMKIHALLFVLWLQSLVRPRSIFLESMVSKFTIEDIGNTEIFPATNFVTIGSTSCGIFVGIPHDDFISGPSSFA